MMKTESEKKMKAAQKKAESFYKQFKKLREKFPEVMVSGGFDGDVTAVIRVDDWNYVKTYLTK
jgi:cell fate (sporulation/competence/biofilm development) regulator YlbF (YheA/YmcA/DUF963 family)